MPAKVPVTGEYHYLFLNLPGHCVLVFGFSSVGYRTCCTALQNANFIPTGAEVINTAAVTKHSLVTHFFAIEVITVINKAIKSNCFVIDLFLYDFECFSALFFIYFQDVCSKANFAWQFRF
jgi:hypothetical protein